MSVTASATTSAAAIASDFGITSASGYSALLPCATYALNSALVSKDYYGCDKANYDAARLTAYIGCLCDAGRFSVLDAISLGIGSATYRSISCNDYQVFSANAVYNGYCSQRGFVLTTVTSGTRTTLTVTSLGGPTATSTPTSTATGSGSSPPPSITKLIIQIVAGVIGGIIVLYILSCCIKAFKRHRAQRPRGPSVARDVYGGNTGPKSESGTAFAASVPYYESQSQNTLQSDRINQWVRNPINAGIADDQTYAPSEVNSEPTHRGTYPMSNLNRAMTTDGRF